jgi:hypothetical protein
MRHPYINGYKMIYDPSNHRSMKSENWLGWMYEHISIAKQWIGRELESSEIVHHIRQ